MLRQRELESQSKMNKNKYDAKVMQHMTASEIGGEIISMSSIKNHDEYERLQKILKLDNVSPPTNTA